jgi:hypothetical protein
MRRRQTGNTFERNIRVQEASSRAFQERVETGKIKTPKKKNLNKSPNQ